MVKIVIRLINLHCIAHLEAELMSQKLLPPFLNINKIDFLD